jgi:hypothetical protein
MTSYLQTGLLRQRSKTVIKGAGLHLDLQKSHMPRAFASELCVPDSSIAYF